MTRRIGFVHNARSTRNREGFAELLPVLADYPEVRRIDFDALASLPEIAAELAAREVDLIVVNGGDGTVQGLLTTLLEDRPFAELPPIAILPRGMANMTAADCGLRRRGPGALERLLHEARADNLARFIVNRRVLRVENLVEATVARGMFLGAVGIFDAVQLCKARVHALGLKGEASHLVTLLGLLAGLAVGRKPAGMLDGEEIGLRIDGEELRRGRELLLLATTLDRLVLSSRPFWNTGDRPVRLTVIGYPPPQLVRSAAKVLYGRDERDLPDDSYCSRGAERVEIELESRFTIDGEYFTPRPNTPVVVTAPDVVRFVRI